MRQFKKDNPKAEFVISNWGQNLYFAILSSKLNKEFLVEKN